MLRAKRKLLLTNMIVDMNLVCNTNLTTQVSKIIISLANNIWSLRAQLVNVSAEET